MKKLLITLIIICIMILAGQFVYYNILDNDNEDKLNSNILNLITANNINTIIQENLIDTNSIIISTRDEVMPSNYYQFERLYTGEVDTEKVSEAIKKFVKQDAQVINEKTTMKSTNYRVQYYDLNTSIINDMNIYSSSDYLQISIELDLLESGDKYISSSIDESTITQTEDGYTTFRLVLKYDNDNNSTDYRTIKLDVSVANSTATEPNIKFSGVSNE